MATIEKPSIKSIKLQQQAQLTKLQLKAEAEMEMLDTMREYMKHIEFAVKYQTEITTAFEELEKHKMLYDKASKESDLAQKKYEDALKKPKSGLQSLKTMVTGKDAASVVQKLKTKAKQKSKTLDEARNIYLLSLQGYNRLVQLYEKEDLPNLMQKLDGKYYETVQTLVNSFSKFQEEVSTSGLTTSETIKQKASLINREKDLSQFLADNNTIFKETSDIQFEPVGLDQTKELVVDEFSKISLGKHLGELIAHDDLIASLQAIKEAELSGAKHLVDVYTNAPQTGNPNASMELIQDIQNSLDLFKCQRAKFGIQIETLKKLNVAPIMPPKPEAVTSSNGAATSMKQIASVLYPYTAENEGDLTVLEGDEVEIVETNSENPGWIKVKVIKTSEVGLIPANYIQVKVQQPLPSINLPLSGSKMVEAVYDYSGTEEGELSFKVGDQIECIDGINAEEEWWEGKLVRTGEIGVFPILFTKGWEAVAASVQAEPAPAQKRPVSMLLSKRQSGMNFKTDQSSVKSLPLRNEPTLFEVQTATVLYQYDATCDGELSLQVGEVIKVLSKDTGNEMWWVGQGKHGKGEFPSNYVRINENPIKVKALYDFTSSTPGELSFKAGDVLNVVQSNDVDWWDGEINGMSGAFPANYVEKIQ
ncbi:Intersectin 1 (SH3 domain protein) [Boothiomyces macroporosus]|uniref:Intersectin 1 (SH3 domain protein) n=1 Tax=Boothiomyces macroporosus TaxID=261099 RepID=A0AAD5Y6L9_9FUNG|nr:Intersectin 1 (SH3 domain protein) [Boothiomyces macroporosus]